MSVLHINKDNFQTVVLDSDKPVLVDFWATWCGPCQMIAPVIEEIAEENPQLTVCKVDVDEEPALAQQFGIMSIPTLLAFKDGEVIAQTVGARPKEQILAMFE